MSKTGTPAAKSETNTVKQQLTEDQIAARAHQIFLERGGAPGHELEDWLQAEKELSKNGRQ